jgi:hypothetical protein
VQVGEEELTNLRDHYYALTKYKNNGALEVSKSSKTANKLQKHSEDIKHQISKQKKKYKRLQQALREEDLQGKATHKAMADMITTRFKMASEEKMIRN